MSKKKKILISVALAILVAMVVFVIINLIKWQDFNFYSLNSLKQAMSHNPDVLQEYNYYLKLTIAFFMCVFLLIGMTSFMLYYFIKKILKK